MNQSNEADPTIIKTENEANKNFDHASTSTNKNEYTKTVVPDPDELIRMNVYQFNQIIAENNALISENQTLKESIELFKNLQQETQKGFGVIQAQLDKLYDLVLHRCRNNETADEVETAKESHINIDFPLKSKKELDSLEDQLDVELEMALVRKFSKICGSSGKEKISKIGLQLVRHLFTDELLNQFSWKGKKGCTKLPFSTYIKTRNLFNKIIRLADSSCTTKEADSFLQNSAIKHSGQRIKRKLCEVNILNPKKSKNEPENATIIVSCKDSHSSNNSQSINTLYKEGQQKDKEESRGNSSRHVIYQTKKLVQQSIKQ